MFTGLHNIHSPFSPGGGKISADVIRGEIWKGVKNMEEKRKGKIKIKRGKINIMGTTQGRKCAGGVIMCFRKDNVVDPK